MVPTSTAAHQSSGPSSIIPPPPLPRPPTAAPGPGAAPLPGHAGHQPMGAPYGNHQQHPNHQNHPPPLPSGHQQQPHGLGPPPGASQYPISSQSPSPRGGGPPGMPVGGHPPSAPSPYHHPLHSPAGPGRQGPHHHQSMPPHHNQHHPQMHPPHPHHPGIPPHQQQYHQHHYQPKQHPPPPQVAPPPHSSNIPRPPSANSNSGTSAQQPTYLPRALNGDWQSDKDISHRRDMIQNIVQLLKQRDKNSSQEWLNKLPQMVKQLEVSLYRSAPSFEAYADRSTLKQRLQRLAMEIAKKTQNGPDDDTESIASLGPPPPPPPPQPSSQTPNGNTMGIGDSRSRSTGRPGKMLPPPPTSTHQPNRQDIAGSQSPFVPTGGPPSMKNDMRKSSHYGNSSRQPDHMSQRGGRSTSTSERSQPGPRDQSMANGSNARPLAPPSSNSQHTGRKPSGELSVSSNNKYDEESRQRIRHKQQRLLLLHHSSKCSYENGKCPVTQHCADMKRLWVHMSKCQDPNCRVPHCYSSRSILSHYRKCKDPKCAACAPVRETVKRGNYNPTPPSTDSGSGGGNGSGSSNSRYPKQEHDRYLDSTSPFVKKEEKSDSIGNGGMRQPIQQPSNGYKNKFDPYNIGEAPPGDSRDRYGNDPRNPPDVTDNGHFPKTCIKAPDVKVHRSPDDHSNDPRGTSDHNDRIRHKQQRLLLLRHASKCKAPDGKCTVTPHCDSMKKLWKHISGCQERECKVPHCMSSRYVLSHYKRCKDLTCPACEPVRKAIRGESPPPDLRPPKRPKPTPTPPYAPQPPPQKKPPLKSPPVPPKPEETSYSLINSFSIEQIELHIKSLNRTIQLPQKNLKEKLLPILKNLQNHKDAWVFNTPVDPVELALPDYFEIIKKPMDLGTIQKKIDAGVYHSIEEFSADVRLTFENAMTYNEEGSVVHAMAKEMKAEFSTERKKLINELESEEKERRKNERACVLCGCEKLQFEPPVYFCHGINCSSTSKRIHRNRHYYVGGNNQYYWCNQCYNELDDDVQIDMVDTSFNKADLKKKKNDEVHEENWVQCDECDRWVHQICGLFNARQNKDSGSKYVCPHCLLTDMKNGKTAPQTTALTAEELPRTKLSEWLEEEIRTKVVSKYAELAREKQELEKISYANAYKSVSGGGKITIRQVTSTDRKLEVRERMKRRYAHKNYPDEFPFRCKCILVFQNLDGVDVVLFALYVYEHGEDNPLPNKRTVYISYLDSVHFMRPRSLRTFVYHEILTSYLDYARQKGYATAHIWACPPLKGDDYIFYAKPESQKIPKEIRLRQWYIDMLIECQKRGIVGRLTNMHDLYFSNVKLDATAVPYLEGDYFCGEAENIIKDLEEGKGNKGNAGTKKSKKKKNGNANKTKSKSKDERKGTRSTGMDSDMTIPADSVASNGESNSERDQVMTKMGETIKPMKESFIVAFLNWSGAKPEDTVVPPEIERVKVKREPDPTPGTKRKRRDSKDGNGKLSLDAFWKKSFIEYTRKSIKIVDDDMEELDCEILNNRQAFLNLCRGNHYQFDELRRAKHTSMMVLWHLHNRDAAKFVQVCNCCGKEILSGVRYTCQTCTDYDLCETCYKDPNANRGLCNHKLVAKSVEGEKANSGSNLTETDAQRKERQRNIQLHIQLLEHASRCNSTSCNSSNCAKMKQYLRHSQDCKKKVAGGCKICKRIWTLLRYHAQSCKNKMCSIPQCIAIRERIRQLNNQQQAMDDRRRQVMNRQYRSGVSMG